MKIVLVILIVLLFAGAGGAYYYLRLPKSDDVYSNPAAETESVTAGQSGDVTLTGVLRKSEGDDYQHIIIVNGRSTGVASQSLDLSQYENMTVSVVGQYSGTTLYADSITEQ